MPYLNTEPRSPTEAAPVNSDKLVSSMMERMGNLEAKYMDLANYYKAEKAHHESSSGSSAAVGAVAASRVKPDEIMRELE